LLIWASNACSSGSKMLFQADGFWSWCPFLFGAPMYSGTESEIQHGLCEEAVFQMAVKDDSLPQRREIVVRQPPTTPGPQER
jgi:hypothetical protein